MRRRDVIGIATYAAIWPSTAFPQGAVKRPTVGFLGTTTRDAWAPWTSAFVTRLRELGWMEGQTIYVEYRWADSQTERFSEIVREFLQLNVDVILTSGSAAAVARKITSKVPIVFALAIDPLGGGLVGSLARPEANVTGLSQLTADLAAKRLEILREIRPNSRHLAIMGDPRISQSIVEMGEVETAARAMGYAVQKADVVEGRDIARVFQRFTQVDALYVSTGPVVNTHRIQIAALAAEARIPTIYSQRQYAEAGGLLSYGPDIGAMFRRAADYVDKILRGARPQDIPVEQPTKFELVINLKTAKALGLTVPLTLLARADEVIE